MINLFTRDLASQREWIKLNTAMCSTDTSQCEKRRQGTRRWFSNSRLAGMPVMDERHNTAKVDNVPLGFALWAVLNELSYRVLILQALSLARFKECLRYQYFADAPS